MTEPKIQKSKPEGEGEEQPKATKERVANAVKKVRASTAAVSTVAKEGDPEEVYELISDEDNELGPRRDGQFLYLTVSAPNSELAVSPLAKAFVYDKRFDFGMAAAGIEPYEGPFPLNEKSQLVEIKAGDVPKKYGYRFRLRPGLSSL